MAAAAAVVSPSGLEDGVSRSRGEGAGEAVVERGPGAAYHMFVVMEDLVEKLKLLRYEEELLRKSNLKPPSRWVPSPWSARRPPGPRGQAFLGLAGNTKRPLVNLTSASQPEKGPPPKLGPEGPGAPGAHTW
jgi:hypothetical protein